MSHALCAKTKAYFGLTKSVDCIYLRCVRGLGLDKRTIMQMQSNAEGLQEMSRKPGRMLALPSLLVFNITFHVFMSVETGYGQDLSAFGHSFADPSQQTASYAAAPSAPSSGAQPAASNFGRGQNHNVQGFHPYRR